MADRRLFTDRFLRSLPPAPPGQRVEVFDARLPGFGIRVSDLKDAEPSRRGKAAKISFVLYARFSPGAAPTRKSIGTYGAISLEEARRIAGEWRSLIARGIDPSVIEAEAREAEAREAAKRIQHSVAAVAEAFITDKLRHERSGRIAERDLRAHFVSVWADRPITEISTLDVLDIINTKKRSAPHQARSLLILVRRFFNWAVDQQIYGIERSPGDRLSVAKVIGPLPSRSRRLSDEELAAFWRATGRMKYPVGPFYRLLALSGLRLNECAHLSWSEIHGDSIIIPAARMKGQEGKAREHALPLSSTAMEIIEALPRHRGGQFLFSLSGGKRPIQMSAQIKRDLDARMLRTLRAQARRRGEDWRAVELAEFVNHDLRRSMRSGMAALRIPPNVCEAVLGHAPPGIVGVYDVHAYATEKAEALQAWADHIKRIVSPAPAAEVIKLRDRRR